MIVCTGFPTEIEIANERKRQFRLAIERKAAVLARSKREQALKAAIASARPLPPEAVPAEPDPPKECPHCNRSLTEPVQVGRRDANSRPFPTVADIQRVVGGYFGISRADICSARRMKEIVEPRQIAMFIAKELTAFSLPTLGRMFGGRDHSTVHHAVRKMARLIETQDGLRGTVDKLMRDLGGAIE